MGRVEIPLPALACRSEIRLLCGTDSFTRFRKWEGWGDEVTKTFQPISAPSMTHRSGLNYVWNTQWNQQCLWLKLNAEHKPLRTGCSRPCSSPWVTSFQLLWLVASLPGTLLAERESHLLLKPPLGMLCSAQNRGSKECTDAERIQVYPEVVEQSRR